MYDFHTQRAQTPVRRVPKWDEATHLYSINLLVFLCLIRISHSGSGKVCFPVLGITSRCLSHLGSIPVQSPYERLK
jgi:hypothetical protein